jgi:hypothetical protein
LETNSYKDSFALIGYKGTGNIGDEIQSLASRQFLPRVDFTIDREFLNLFEIPEGRRAKMILHGWFSHRPENWPPSESLIPLITSLHLSPGVPSEVILREPALKYLKGFGPIGARDFGTLEALQKAGVESFFSGCMTLTHNRRPVERDGDLVVANEVPGNVLDVIGKKTKKKIEWTSHIGHNDESQTKRFEIAEDLLKTYSKASVVVTTRLHCALPCLAMGTPVLLLDTAKDQWRFDGLNDFVHHCSPEAFLKDNGIYDVDAPPPNPDRHLPHRDALIRRAKEFIATPIDDASYQHPLSWQERYRLLRSAHSRVLGEARDLRKILAEKSA